MLESVRRIRSLSVILPVLESVWPLVGWGLSLTRSMRESDWWYVRSVVLSCSTCPGICLVFRREESFSYTPRAAICLVVKRVGSYSYIPRLGVCLVVRREGSITSTPCASICVVFGWWDVSVTRPVMESVCSFGGYWSLFTPRARICLVVRRLGSFSYTPRAGN